MAREFGHLAGQLHPGRAGTDHHERQPLRSFLRIDCQLSHLEGEQHPMAKVPRVLNRLHPVRVLGKIVTPEIGMRRSSGHDQRVVGQPELSTVGAVSKHLLRHHIEFGHFAEQRPDVRLVADHSTQRRRDQAGRQDAGRHLIEKRLKQMMIRAVDQGDVGLGLAQRPNRAEPAESTTDYDHAMPIGHAASRVQAQAEAFRLAVGSATLRSAQRTADP
jgi:hypothetical protein